MRKLWHKKWMSCCLLIGITLLAATTVSFPMYRNAAYNRLMQDYFDQYLAETGEWPAKATLTHSAFKDAGGAALSGVEAFLDGFHEQIGVKEKLMIHYYCLTAAPAGSLMRRDDLSEVQLRVAFMSDMENHINIIAGEDYSSESGIAEDGSVEALVSESCLVNCNLLVGETLEFARFKTPEGEPLRVRIMGVFEADDTEDQYWQLPPETLNNVCMIKENVYREYFTGAQAGNYNMTCTHYALWEYKDLLVENVGHLLSQMDDIMRNGEFGSFFTSVPYYQLLQSFQLEKLLIDTTLFLLQVPVWILLAAYLFMISTQMYDVERNEISVMKSRGSSGLQIFLLYLYQSVFLTLLGAAAGLPLGSVFARALGASGSFLEFQLTRHLNVVYTRETAVYAIVAMAGCILMIALPAIRHSKISIVNLKQQKASKKRSWWERCFLDLIFLGISIYGYRTCAQNQDVIAASSMAGVPMEPLMYLSSSLFILGAGLLLLRLQPLLVNLVYFVGKRFWRPASYISFLENRKNGRKQQFIMLFLILSISLGIYHATAARTILENARENASYLDGADLIVKENWRDNSSEIYDGEASELRYYEPNYDKYRNMANTVSYTRVIYDEGASLADGASSRQNITLMGIHTKQFGETTSLPAGLMEKTYHTYLNELAAQPRGVLVSSSFRDYLGYRQGDSITFYNGRGKQTQATIVDFVDYWPGFVTSQAVWNPNITVSVRPGYLVVANFATLTNQWGTTPYEVWIKMEDGKGTDAFVRWMDEEEVSLAKYVDREADLQDVLEDPLLQGTNGILTMGFLMTMILCATGYLIYWILSIRSRELVFGILRAEGMHRSEIYHILLNEQIFCGGFAVVTGTAVGILSSRMFVPILQAAYAANDQVLPMRLVTRGQDMLRLFGVIGGTLAVCLIVLVIMVRRLNVSKALKIGEE